MLSFVRLQWRRLALYCVRGVRMRRGLRGDGFGRDAPGSSCPTSGGTTGGWGCPHVSIPSLLLPFEELPALTGSGAMPWRGCASCGRSFGKATEANSTISASLSSMEFSESIFRGNQRRTIVLDVVRGAAAVGGKGRKNKVGDGKRPVQF